MVMDSGPQSLSQTDCFAAAGEAGLGPGRQTDYSAAIRRPALCFPTLRRKHPEHRAMLHSRFVDIANPDPVALALPTKGQMCQFRFPVLLAGTFQTAVPEEARYMFHTGST